RALGVSEYDLALAALARADRDIVRAAGAAHRVALAHAERDAAKHRCGRPDAGTAGAGLEPTFESGSLPAGGGLRRRLGRRRSGLRLSRARSASAVRADEIGGIDRAARTERYGGGRRTRPGRSLEHLLLEEAALVIVLEDTGLVRAAAERSGEQRDRDQSVWVNSATRRHVNPPEEPSRCGLKPILRQHDGGGQARRHGWLTGFAAASRLFHPAPGIVRLPVRRIEALFLDLRPLRARRRHRF